MTQQQRKRNGNELLALPKTSKDQFFIFYFFFIKREIEVSRSCYLVEVLDVFCDLSNEIAERPSFQSKQPDYLSRSLK